MKKLSILLMACLAFAATAQNSGDNKQQQAQKDKDELYQVVIGDKDFVPVKRNVVMKNTLPEVKRTATKNAVTPDYSHRAVATVVPNRVPTMLPYGYRTAHNFSAQRGYLDLGAGSQLNLTASLGYRFIDEEDFNLEAWAQHNSTWEGRNASTLLSPKQRQKQRYNDNILGLDLEKVFTRGSLGVGARFHYDSFNYYGGRQNITRYDNKQGFMAVAAEAVWKGHAVTPAERQLRYNLGLRFEYGKYEKGIPYYLSEGDGKALAADEVVLAFDGGVNYQAGTRAQVGLDLGATFVGNDRGHIDRPAHYSTIFRSLPWEATDSRGSYGVFDIAPYFRFEGDNFRASLGATATLSAGDGAKALVSPRVKFDVDMADGANFYVNALGGKTIHTLSSLHEATRYVNPSQYVCNTFSPLDLEVGLKLGPWRDFSANLFAGYGIFRNAVTTMYGIYFPVELRIENTEWAFANLYNLRARGVKVGFNINYRYRDIVEVDAGFTFAPQDDKPIDDGKRYAKSYLLGLDGASTVGNIDVTVRPINKLSLGIGFDYRGGRRVNFYEQFIELTGEMMAYPPTFSTRKLSDVLNLRLRAEYRITPRFGVWASASNLLGKRWDVLPGMSCQNLGLMGGITLNF